MLEILFGIISGIFSGIGMGGGSILILLLTTFLNINQHTAQATNLIYFIPTSVTALIVNFREKNIDFKLAFQILFWGILGAIIGSFLSFKINILVLKKFFGIFLILISLHEIYTLFKQYKQYKIRQNKYSQNKK